MTKEYAVCLNFTFGRVGSVSFFEITFHLDNIMVVSYLSNKDEFWNLRKGESKSSNVTKVNSSSNGQRRYLVFVDVLGTRWTEYSHFFKVPSECEGNSCTNSGCRW